jgi:hypothetical protein
LSRTSDEPQTLPKTPSFAGKLLALLGVIASCAYLANLGAGVLGEIPDIIPGAGNLDEVFFSALLILCLHYLGIHIIPGTSTRHLANSPADAPKLKE